MLLEIVNDDELKNLITNIEKDKTKQICKLNEKIHIKKGVKSVVFLIDAQLINSKKELTNMIKKILRIQKKYKKKEVCFGTTLNNKEILCIINNINNIELNKKNYKEFEITINLFKIKNKKDRIEYVYDNACDYLDSECKRLNYCDFKNNVCIGKRNTNGDREVEMGCCYHVNIFSFKPHKMCEYVGEKGCTTKCFACKLFTCDAVKQKYKIKDITYMNCFFNVVQKLILRVSILTPKEKIISRLLLF